jgi:hypothetical protein
MKVMLQPNSELRFAMDAMRYYLRAMESKNAPMAKALGSEELAEKYSEAKRKIAKKWWSTVSEEEKMAHIRKANEARWGKKQEPPAESSSLTTNPKAPAEAGASHLDVLSG